MIVRRWHNEPDGICDGIIVAPSLIQLPKKVIISYTSQRPNRTPPQPHQSARNRIPPPPRIERAVLTYTHALHNAVWAVIDDMPFSDGSAILR